MTTQIERLPYSNTIQIKEETMYNKATIFFDAI